MTLWGRIYSDYLMPDRWDSYRELLATAQAQGYTFVLHRDALETLAGEGDRFLLLRHDIDTDNEVARKMFEIEQEMGVRGTWYFRRCTMDIPLMRAIADSGSEVGYHYEELSDFCKARCIRTQAQAIAELRPMREAFLENLKAFEEALGRKVLTVTGHGDFLNRRLDLPNTVLIDEEVRARGGIRLEGYDQALMDLLTFHTIDKPIPTCWYPEPPLPALQAGSRAVLVKVHPRQWQRAPLSRFRTDLQRLREGLSYEVKRAASGSSRRDEPPPLAN